VSDQDQAARLYAEGHALANAGRWPEAEARFARAAELAPAASLNWLSGAIACWHQNRFAEASNAIEWALHKIPIRATPESETGIKCFEAGDWRGVEMAFRQLLDESPVDTPTYLFLAIALIRQERFAESFDQLLAGYNQEIAEADSGSR
jgi:Flp pilus assembly protein TadD